MSRYNKCSECGGIYGHHMTGCPETPEEPEEDTDEKIERLEKENEEMLIELKKLRNVFELSNDAVEAGAIDECYLSLLQDAINS